MARGALGATGPHVQRPAAKEYNIGDDSVTIPHRPMMAICARDQQIRACHVTKATVQVIKRSMCNLFERNHEW